MSGWWGDGGWWNFVTSLIDKYGVVPASVMPETHSSENTRVMNTVLGTAVAVTCSGNSLRLANQGGSVKALRSCKGEGAG